MRFPVLLAAFAPTCFLPGAEPFDVLSKTTWISDQAGTVAWIGAHRPDLAKVKGLDGLFGRMTVSFTDQTVTTIMDGHADKRPNRILGQTTREIATITYDAVLGRDAVVVIEMDADARGYWIYNSQFDVKEHFVPAP